MDMHVIEMLYVLTQVPRFNEWAGIYGGIYSVGDCFIEVTSFERDVDLRRLKSAHKQSFLYLIPNILGSVSS